MLRVLKGGGGEKKDKSLRRFPPRKTAKLRSEVHGSVRTPQRVRELSVWERWRHGAPSIYLILRRHGLRTRAALPPQRERVFAGVHKVLQNSNDPITDPMQCNKNPIQIWEYIKKVMNI